MIRIVRKNAKDMAAGSHPIRSIKDLVSEP